MKNASEKPPIFSAPQTHAIDVPLAVNQAPATVPASAEAADLGQSELYINRELSLLEFNRRVLELAKDESILLLERLKFLCICSINLDEFFEIRVAGLKQQVAYGSVQRGPDNLTPAEQLRRISETAHGLVKEQYEVLNTLLIP